MSGIGFFEAWIALLFLAWLVYVIAALIIVRRGGYDDWWC